MVLNPKLAVGVVVILWALCLLKKGSFYIIGKQTSGLLCSQLYLFSIDHNVRAVERLAAWVFAHSIFKKIKTGDSKVTNKDLMYLKI